MEGFLRQRKHHEFFVLNNGLAAVTRCARARSLSSALCSPRARCVATAAARALRSAARRPAAPGLLPPPSRWVQPYANGAKPTLLVREKMCELLALLPLNTGIETLREVLVKSGLGRVVNCYATLPNPSSDRKRPRAPAT